MKALHVVSRWYATLQRPKSCLQLVPSTLPLDYFLNNYIRSFISRSKSLFRVSHTTRSIQTANVGKVKPIPSIGSRTTQGGLNGESLVARIARRYGHRDTQAATLSRQAIQKILALRQSVPLLGLTGLCLVDKPTLITPDEELEIVCVEIRKIVDKINFDVSTQSILTFSADKPITLSCFELGDPIAKGCNAVVYSARYDPSKQLHQTIREEEEEEEDLIEELTGSPPLSSSPPSRKYGKEYESKPGSLDTVAEQVENLNSMDSFNLAIKMMFNYDAESNAAAIWNSLSRECVPVANNQLTPTRDVFIPSHPCIVDIKAAFVDRIPLLRGAEQLYPQALPPRLNEQGFGRNATMFLVMKRYNCTLRGYLMMKSKQKEILPEKVKLSFCVQLFEAVAHLVKHGVAHRDLKSDNVLVDIGSGPGETQLALSDFGCCLIPTDCLTPLKLSFISNQVSKGGNLALMAPEVQTATAGLLSFIDYSKADLWSVATLVYEIYGQKNPFFEGQLSSKTYKDQDLPCVFGAPPAVQALIRECLRRDPSKRPSPELASTILQLVLHCPKHLFSSESTSPQQVVQWLCDLAVEALFADRKEETNDRRSMNQHLKRMFLAEVHLHTVLKAIDFIRCYHGKFEAREDHHQDREFDRKFCDRETENTEYEEGVQQA